MAEQDKELQTVHAPYNFIEFPRQILEDRADNVDHSCLDASRRTGEIKITLTAETPVFVSDGNKDDPHFFRAPELCPARLDGAWDGAGKYADPQLCPSTCG